MKINKEVKVGLLATTAFIIIYLGSNFLKGQELFSSNHTYYTTYDHTAGLRTSSPVLVNGMTVGRVRSIRILPEKGYSALVTFEVKKDITLTDTTKAQLVSRSLLGEKAIELFIEPGSPLKKLDTVPGQIEQSLGDTVMSASIPALNDVRGISQLANQFLTSLVENTDKINSILMHLEATTKELSRTVSVNQVGFSKVTKNLTAFSSVLVDDEKGMVPLLSKLNQLMAGLEGQEAKLIVTKLDNILGSLEQVLSNPGGGQSNLGKLLYDEAFYHNLNQILVSLDSLLVDWKAHPWRYVNFSVFGKKQRYKERIKK